MADESADEWEALGLLKVESDETNDEQGEHEDDEAQEKDA
jgi:hypothetical protein